MSILCDVFNDNFDFRANIFKEFDITRKDDEEIETDASIESIIGVIDELQTNYENVICEHSVQALKYMLKFKTNADYNIVEGEVNQALLKQGDEMASLKFGKMQPAYYPEGGRREIRRQKNKTAKQARKMGGLEKIEIDESGGRRGVMRNYVPEGVLNQYSDKGRCKTYIYVAADNKEKEEAWVNVISQIALTSKNRIHDDMYKNVLRVRFQTIECTEWMKNSNVKIVTPKTKVPLSMRLQIDMIGIRVLWGKAYSLRSVNLSNVHVDDCQVLCGDV